MIFPSTQVDFSATRLPWMSAGLVLVSLCIFLATPAPPSVDSRTPAAAREAAFAYWQTHGYLTPGARVLEAAPEHFDSRTQRIALAAIRELGRRAMPAAQKVRQREQATLDHLTEVARSDRDSINPLPGDHPLRVYGFDPSSPSALTALAHVFFYAGWPHFLPVLTLLFVLGASAEERFGAPALGLLFFVSAFVSAGFHMLLESESPMSSIGAAGPVAALLAVFLLRHSTTPVRMVALAGGRHGLKLVPFELPAAVIPAFWVVVTLGLTVWLDEIGARNGLSVSAVAGGLGFGLLTGLALRRLGVEGTYLGPELEAELRSSARPSTIDEALVARDMGDIDRAFELFRSEALQSPGDPEITTQFWDLAVSTGQADAAAEAMANQIRRLIRRNDLPAAAELWRLLVDQLPNHRLPADDLVRIVPPLLADHHDEFALAALRQCVDAPPSEVSTTLALRVLDLAEELDPFTTLLAARRALDLPELHESKRARIVALIAELDPETPPPAKTTEAGAAPDGETAPPEIAIDEETASEPQQIDLASLPRFESLQAVEASPTRLHDDALYFRLSSGHKAKVAYEQIQAIAVVALRDISSKPVVMIDLLLNWTELSDMPLRSIRLRSDRFDPAHLIASTGSPTDNLRVFLAELLDRSGALPLPDAASVRGQPFQVFKFLRAYQRRVLKVDC